MIDFPHSAPKGYSYEIQSFIRNVLAIWIINHGEFSYTNKNPKSIWGFYNTKKQCYHAPVDSTKQGDPVDINSTTPYSAMKLNLNPLMQCLMSL